VDIVRVKSDYNKARGQATQFAPIFRQYQKLAANTVDDASTQNPFPYGEGTACLYHKEDASESSEADACW
jgi:hypothetical protein